MMDAARYHEILPAAYVAAAVEKGGRPSPFMVGMAARDIATCEEAWHPAYRIAMATAIPAEIVKVEHETTSFGVGRFHITYRSLAKKGEIETINTPLLNDRNFGNSVNTIWNRYDEKTGKNSWIGKRMILYKHNDPPREGDRSSQGYRVVVYAEPMT